MQSFSLETIELISYITISFLEILPSMLPTHSKLCFLVKDFGEVV